MALKTIGAYASPSSPGERVAPDHAADVAALGEDPAPLGPVMDLGASPLRRQRVEHAEPEGVDPPLVEGDRAVQAGPERWLELVELAGREAGGRLAPLQRLEAVIGAEVGLVGVPGRPLPERRPLLPGGEGHQERDPEEQVRRDLLDVAGVPARQGRDLPVGDHVPDAAVDHPGAVAAGADAEVGLLQQEHGEATQREVARGPDAVDPAPEDDYVEVPAGSTHPGSLTR